MSSVKPVSIGITGGIGAGKSTVSKIFEALGIPCYNADSRAKWLLENDPEINQQILKYFGDQAYNSGGYNRNFIAREVFSNPVKLNKLNEIVHPAVAKDFIFWLQSQTAPYTLKEAALLVEQNLYQTLDALIVVTASEEIRINRVIARDTHRSIEDVRKIISNQLPESVKVEKADYVISNDEEKMVVPQVLSIHRQILDRFADRRPKSLF